MGFYVGHDHFDQETAEQFQEYFGVHLKDCHPKNSDRFSIMVFAEKVKMAEWAEANPHVPATEAYEVRYGKEAALLLWNIHRQSPKTILPE